VDVHPSSEQNAAESSAKRLRRKRRKRKTRSEKLKAMLAGRGYRLAALFFLMLAVLILFVPFDDRLEIVQWAIFVGSMLAFVIMLTIDARNRYRSNQANFVSSGCPSCGYAHLKRMERLKRDRMIGNAAGVPIRRYICPECHWKGTRVNEEYL
jgi:predicted RNA-binding Zn-ribbon protein involved in translation (DUF1610 family)